MIQDFYPGSGFFYISDPDPESRDQKSTGSRIRIRNTGIVLCSINHVLTGSMPDEAYQRKMFSSPVWVRIRACLLVFNCDKNCLCKCLNINI